jgi:uncharacterized membrane protein YhaH (DUF805 family)
LSSKTKHEDLALSQVGPVEAFTTAWRKSFTYGGKATRAEYWWFYLIDLVITFVVIIGLSANSFNPLFTLGWLYVVASIFPSVSIVVRRLRDIGKQWQWIFIGLVPFIGGIWFIYLMCQPSGRYEAN